MKGTKAKQAGRGVTLLALAAALGAAVYLNWSFAQDTPQTIDVQTEDTAAVSAEAGDEEAQAVQAPAEDSGEAAPVYDPLTTGEETAAEGDTADKNYGEAQLVSVSEDTGTEFFESARLNREKSRDEALDTIEKTLKSASLSDEEKQTATETLQAQITNIELEAELETLIKAKGFVDCVVMLGADTADVTVMTENDALTAAEVTQIRDVILSKCPDVKAQGITVVEVRTAGRSARQLGGSAQWMYAIPQAAACRSPWTSSPRSRGLRRWRWTAWPMFPAAALRPCAAC